MTGNANPNRATIGGQIAGQLREAILAGELSPGIPLREEDLARRFKVSRHLIREVLRHLASEGLAEYVPFRGVRVPLITLDQVRKIYRARHFLEVNALAQGGGEDATQGIAKLHTEFVDAVKAKAWREAFRIDMAFHSSIVAVAGNDLVKDWHRDLVLGLSLAHLIVPAFEDEGFEISVSEHAEIALALAAGDVARAQIALAAHLARSERMLAERMGASVAGADGEQLGRVERSSLSIVEQY